MKNKAVFLDRDGIINRELGRYVLNLGEFEVLPNLIPFMQEARRRGFLLIVISNQGGIGRGLYTKQFVELCHQKLSQQLQPHQLNFDEIYYCPHYPDQSHCLCRKPDSLLIEKALARFRLDPDLCLMIGDKQRDVEAAQAAGVKGFLVSSNPELQSLLDCLNP